jgi:hypothetical protein
VCVHSCLIFVQRLKHSGPWTGKLFLFEEVVPLILTPPTKRKKQDAIASWALRVARIRGHRWKSTKAVVDHLLVDVEVGASDELPLLVK